MSSMSTTDFALANWLGQVGILANKLSIAHAGRWLQPGATIATSSAIGWSSTPGKARERGEARPGGATELLYDLLAALPWI